MSIATEKERVKELTKAFEPVATEFREKLRAFVEKYSVGYPTEIEPVVRKGLKDLGGQVLAAQAYVAIKQRIADFDDKNFIGLTLNVKFESDDGEWSGQALVKEHRVGLGFVMLYDDDTELFNAYKDVLSLATEVPRVPFVSTKKESHPTELGWRAWVARSEASSKDAVAAQVERLGKKKA